MQKPIMVLVVVLLTLTISGFGQAHSAGTVFFGYAYNRGETGLSGRGNLNGWDAALEGKIFPFISGVADVGGQYGNVHVPFAGGTSKARVTSFLFGPRVSVSIGKFRPFAHALFGGSHLSESDAISNSQTAFADAFGGGIDYFLFPRVSWRLQGDSLQTRFYGRSQNDFRFVTGVVVKF